MSKSKESKKEAYSFGIKAGDETAVYAFVPVAFKHQGVVYQVAELFEGETLKSEFAELATYLVTIQSGIIAKIG